MDMAARTAAWAKRGGLPTAKDYVQDGLVAMWDGIENAGWGTHDAVATVWKDLVGTANMTANGTPVWADDRASFNGSFSFRGNSADVVDALKGDCTFEFVLKPRGYKSNGGVYDFGGVGHDSWAFSWNNEQKRANWFNAMTFQKAKITPVANQFSYDMDDWTERIVSLTSSGGAISQYVDGVLVGSATKGSVTSSQNTFAFGYIFNYSSGIFDLCRGAIYNRALTSAEVPRNYAIDKARFNLP